MIILLLLSKTNLTTEKNPEIYFHVGMGKTGSKYIQYRVFPKFERIRYIQRTNYKKAKDIIQRGESPKYLVSNEFDQQLEKEVKEWATTFPDTHPIIVFRRQDSWIASQYRRYIKNSYTFSFSEFIDLKNDNGYFKKRDLEFFKNIELLEHYFTKKPLVLLYDDLKNKPTKFIQQVANYADVKIDMEKIDFSRKHTSYSLKQLNVIRRISQFVDLRKRRVTNNPVLHRLFLIGLSTIRYPILYGAKLVPASWVEEKPLITEKELEAVRDLYAADWKKCLEYSETQQWNTSKSS